MINKSTYNLLNLSLISLASVSGFSQSTNKNGVKPNILFIAVDDLKPILGCYGDSIIKTPNIDRIAKNGTVFLSNYCQQAVSGPTRASLMTGMRPDFTKVWDLKTKMRDINPDIVSLPQYLISQGYSTQGIGKIYDQRCVDNKMDEPSWSVPYYNYSGANKKYINSNFDKPVLGSYQLPDTKLLVEKYAKEAQEKGLEKKEVYNYISERIKPSIECIDVPDNAYNDGANALNAKDILIELKKKNQPFFFAVGFAKPHLPFVAPKKYWDLYKREQIPIAAFQEKSKNGPDVAYHNSGEIRSYTDIPPLTEFTDQKDVGITLPIDKQKELIHGYFAAVSYTDAQIGILMNALDSLGLSKNTIIVLWGDHGWHLGDHNLWCKHTNFEQATHAPLIISAPWIKPSVSKSITEFVDIFPTLCELANVPVPTHLDGKSQVSVMKKPTTKVKEYAMSQYPRGSAMGYTIRTKRFRYTVWVGNNYSAEKPFSEAKIEATEMYDYKKDPLETKSLIGEKTYKKEEEMMKQLFGEAMEREHEQFVNYSKLANWQTPISTTPEKKGRKK